MSHQSSLWVYGMTVGLAVALRERRTLTPSTPIPYDGDRSTPEARPMRAAGPLALGVSPGRF